MNFSCESGVELLISKLKSGDEAAFEELVRIYEPMLFKTARSLSLDEREIYSDSCLALRRAAMTFTAGKDVTFGLYAKICVTRAMLDLARKNKKLQTTVDFDAYDVAVSDGVQSRLEREEELDALKERVKAILSELEYEVFLLWMNGYKISEIAERLGKSSKTVENAKARMLKRLRAEIGSAEK